MYTLTVPFPFGKTEIPAGIASNVYPFTVSPTVSRASTVLPAGASGPVTIMGACEVLKPGLVGAAPTTGAVDAAIAIPAMAATKRRRDNEWCMGLLRDDWGTNASGTWSGSGSEPPLAGLDCPRYPSPRAPYSQPGPLGALPCTLPGTIWCTGAPRKPRSRGRPNKRGRPSGGRPLRARKGG